jgi:hypothetical protein
VLRLLLHGRPTIVACKGTSNLSPNGRAQGNGRFFGDRSHVPTLSRIRMFLR